MKAQGLGATNIAKELGIGRVDSGGGSGLRGMPAVSASGYARSTVSPSIAGAPDRAWDAGPAQHRRFVDASGH